MPDPALEITTLSTEWPILMFPVRLETRFYGTTTPELRIRIYPDEIFADLHDPALTDEERAAGETYWQTAWNEAEEPNAWRTLLSSRRAMRAAWIVRALTPTNLASPRPPGGPTFPQTTHRDHTWSIPPRTNVLPRCFTAIAYRGGVEVRRAIGNVITEPLQLSFRPDAAESELIDHQGLRIEPEVLWLIDFMSAEAAGMALRMPLDQTDLANGFDRLIVVGVKTELTPTESEARLTSLLDAHHYTRGLALVKQGTPTNNSDDTPSAYPPPNDASASYPIERGAELAVPGSDGAIFAQALGVDPEVFAHVAGAEGIEQTRSKAMSRALWPCTLGYFLDQLMHPELSATDLSEAREHFEHYVRGRGPYPAFRVGGVPYGLLPVTSVQRWNAASGAGSLDTRLPQLIEAWRTSFMGLISGVPRIGRTSDPDADLLAVLGLDASAREVRIREAFGPAYINNTFQLLGYNLTLDDAARDALIQPVLSAAGLSGTNPRLKAFTWGSSALRFRNPFVTAEPLSEVAPLSTNYIEIIRDSAIDVLRTSIQPGNDHPLLHQLLRQAALLEYNRVGVELAIGAGAANDLDRREVELFRVAPGTEARLSCWDRFAQPIRTVTDQAPLGEWLLAPSTDPERATIREYREALDVLAPAPTAELDRLLTETLDVCSHRLDAWITSLATKRLAAMRASKPAGVHLGAYGFVESLRRRVAPRTGTPGGFIHAPSPQHAAAAAVLRNAHLTRTGTQRDQVTVDLSSPRVRRALSLLDGVRGGQPLAALLGYRFERAMHDRQLDRYISRFRALYPLASATNVVDGLTLRDAVIPWNDPQAGLPPPGAERDATLACLAELEDDVDATADLLLAESVFQTVRGNIDRASATLGTIAGNGPVPDPQIVATPRSGTTFTQRVALVLGSVPEAPPAGWPASTPRQQAEPRLNAWAALMFGAASQVTCRVRYLTQNAVVSLEALGLQPLDVLSVLRRSSADGSGELAARIESYVRTTLAVPDAEIAIDYERGAWTPANGQIFPELFEAARELDALIADARPLTDAELGASGQPAPWNTAELAGRATRAMTSLDNIALNLAAECEAVRNANAPVDLSQLRARLWRATQLGLRAQPVNLSGSTIEARDALVAQGDQISMELERRRAAAAAASGGLEKLRGVFEDELKVLPLFAPSERVGIESSIADSTMLNRDRLALRLWSQRIARVRPRLGRVRMLELITRSTVNRALDLDVAQLPFVAGSRWVGLPFLANQRARAGVLSLVLRRELAPAAAAEWSGLVIDEWPELIPAAEHTTAFAVHHDDPGAEAPQTVLLAVSPSTAPTWDLPSLIDTLHETFELAKLRSIDGDLLGGYATLTPSIYLAGNTAGDTISNDLSGLRMFETNVLPPE